MQICNFHLDVQLHLWVKCGILEVKMLNDRYKSTYIAHDSILQSLKFLVVNQSSFIFQVIKFEGCNLVKFADMPFDLDAGSCNSFELPTPKVLLCFYYYQPQKCHTLVL